MGGLFTTPYAVPPASSPCGAFATKEPEMIFFLVGVVLALIVGTLLLTLWQVPEDR